MIKYSAGYKYQLRADYAYQSAVKPAVLVRVDDWVVLHPTGLLEIRAGYAWDGASGPAIDTKTILRGSLVHDAFYQLMREGLLDIRWRDRVDYEFWDICKEDGMSWFRAWYVYQAVRRFGETYAQPTIRSVLTAP